MTPHPSQTLNQLRKELAPLPSSDSPEFASFLDKRDPLARFRTKFEFPTLGSLPRETKGDPISPVIYMCGNSLGLKPKQADVYMKEQLESWANNAAFMHFTGRVPAALADQPGKKITAEIVGANSLDEVAIMNGLTVNLHLLMLAFYQPEGKRCKILLEDHAFPSDRYAIRSLLRLKGVGEEGIVMVKPREGEDTIRTEDILEVIQREKDSLALVMLSGIQYYTGQKFDMKTITQAGHAVGAKVGWDLAHAVGNARLHLSDWNVDFAVWCTYKYLNSGAGGIGGAFVHSRHHAAIPPHLEGWWSNKQQTRFEMRQHLDPAPGAECFRLCNPPPWLTALNLASLEIFHEAGLEAILTKQRLLTGYLESLLKERLGSRLRIITPSNPDQRGSQLSLVFNCDLQQVHERIESAGVVCDVRLPSAMRIAPAPLYNNFSDVLKFVTILEEAILSCED